MNVPTAVLRQAYAQLVANEDAAEAAPLTQESQRRWHAAMNARVNFGIYVMRELSTIKTPNVDVEAT